MVQLADMVIYSAMADLQVYQNALQVRHVFYCAPAGPLSNHYGSVM